MSALHDQLLHAHARDDRSALITLYQRAADDTDDVDAACFFLTNAYIFALELGDPVAEVLHARLKVQGRV